MKMLRSWVVTGLVILLLSVRADAQQGINTPSAMGTAANPIVIAPPGAALPVASPVCVPTSGTLANVGDSVTISCPNIAAFRAILVPNASTPFNGTVQATDPVSGVTRAIFKNVTGETDTSTFTYANSVTTTSEMSFVAFDGIKLTVTAAVSGSMNVTLNGSTATRGTFQNNPVHNSMEAALRNGRAYTATSGIQAVASGNFVSLLFSVPATANYRAVIYDRVLNCNQPTATTPGEFYGVSNPTANLTGGTAATITNRKTGGASSLASVSYFMATTHPDTNPAATLPPGGFLKTGGDATNLGEPFIRTVEPGTSFVNWIGGTNGALATASRCYITYLWYEEVVAQ